MTSVYLRNKQARLTAATASREAARALMRVRAAESLKRKADAQLAVAERAIGCAGAAEANEQAEARQGTGRRDGRRVRGAGRRRQSDAATEARCRGVSTRGRCRSGEMRAAAAEAAREATRDLEPVLACLSRKAQRLCVRQAFRPILESPVTIQDVDRPIGTHIFTAMERIGDADMRWSVVTLESGYPGGAALQGFTHGRGGRDQRESGARPDRHCTGRTGSYRWNGIATIFTDHLGRGVEPGDRQGHRVYSSHKR